MVCRYLLVRGRRRPSIVGSITAADLRARRQLILSVSSTWLQLVERGAGFSVSAVSELLEWGVIGSTAGADWSLLYSRIYVKAAAGVI